MGLSRTILLIAVGSLAAILLLLFIALIVQRSVLEWRAGRTLRLAERYRPLIAEWYAADTNTPACGVLESVPTRHRAAVGTLLTKPLQAFSGDIVDRSRALLEDLGLVETWVRELRDRRWWRRAKAAGQLGLARAPAAIPELIARLNDEHAEVCAAALDALARIGDPSVIPALIAQLRGTRAQRTRVIGALREFGPAAAAELVLHGSQNADERAVIADTLGAIGSGAGLERLLEWCAESDPAVRAASLRAIGSIGLDDRAYYFALRGMSDDAPEVRAMAARALGRSGRADAADVLAARLDDEWIVAAHAARSLRQLGSSARPHLERWATQNGQGGELARQMLWETGSYA